MEEKTGKKQTATLTISFDKSYKKIDMSKFKVGEERTIKATGKIFSTSFDKFGGSIGMEISDLGLVGESKSSINDDLSKIRKRRRIGNLSDEEDEDED